ncbi:hypothetical protein CDAR_496291 [Caerostris darwini]|uniref:Uncharacterized protein n=1 Tax=Caerostris darwini TaxID=1538125 RepID=A0AAV4MX99_9ARAC|nr:hypothetical protein CDAR_496291 [Caerostris darwini]
MRRTKRRGFVLLVWRESGLCDFCEDPPPDICFEGPSSVPGRNFPGVGKEETIDPIELRGKRELLTIDLRVLGLRVALGQPRLGAVSGARLGAAQMPEELAQAGLLLLSGHISLKKENQNL